MNQPDGNGFRVRSLAVPVYIPNLLFAVGQGAVIPVIALLALELGASPAVAGGVVALRAIGTLVFDVPAGMLVARLGERRSMMVSTAVLAVIAFGIGLRPSLPGYAILVFLMGGSWAVWLIARLAFATEASPAGHRGRVMSMMGGVQRMGHLAGPLLSGAVVVPLGLAGPFFVQAAMAVIATVTLAMAPADQIAAPTPDAVQRAPATLRGILRENRRVLGTAGAAVVIMQILRSARQAVLPLWGDHIGLTASQISLLFALTSTMEVLLFYPTGIMMDRKGRKWAAIPCMALLAVSMALIPATSDMVGLGAVVVLMGVGNGLGSGINMTLASDFSPDHGRNQFFGLWRLVTDLGTAGGPLAVAFVTSLASLGGASVAVGALGAVGAAILWRAVPETRAD